MRKASKYELIMRWIKNPYEQWTVYKDSYPNPIKTAMRHIKLAPWRTQ